jgi:hypothetical protein
MLSGRRKRDCEADSRAAQTGDPGAGDPADISANEVAEVATLRRGYARKVQSLLNARSSVPGGPPGTNTS